MSEPEELPRCQHCKAHAAMPGKRGLCWHCYKTPIRFLYRCKPGHTDSKDRSASANMTEAELDALIESRRPTMPKH